MAQDPLLIEELAGSQDGQHVLRLVGPVVLTTVFDFQAKLRNDTSKNLVLDFTNVPYVDSAGIGALVGAHVSRQKDGRSLLLVGVSERIRHALQVTHVEQFFQYSDTLPGPSNGA